MYGNDGNDVLQSDASNDALVGGLGRDTLTGRDGSDRFYFFSPDEETNTITDFFNSLVAGFSGDDDEIWISAEGLG